MDDEGEGRFLAMCSLSLKFSELEVYSDVDGEAAMGGAGWNSVSWKVSECEGRKLNNS